MSIFGGIRRSPADAAFSNYIRTKANWACEWLACGRQFPASKSRGRLHCSHYITRANPWVRFDVDNVAALCAKHHDYVSKYPNEHESFFRRRLGNERYRALLVRAMARKSGKIDHKLEAIRWKKALNLLEEIQ